MYSSIPLSGWLDCLHLLTIVNNAAMNTALPKSDCLIPDFILGMELLDHIVALCLAF